jgi:hypothetical protein
MGGYNEKTNIGFTNATPNDIHDLEEIAQKLKVVYPEMEMEISPTSLNIMGLTTDQFRQLVDSEIRETKIIPIGEK